MARQDNLTETALKAGQPADEAIPARQHLEAALRAHGLAASQLRKLLAQAAPFEGEDLRAPLARALAKLYLFNPLNQAKSGRFMFVGAPGSGKTLAVAKLASRARAANGRVRLVTSDAARSGGIEQLRHLGKTLGLEVEAASGKEQLAALGPNDGCLVLIDSAGINPYSPADRQELETLAQAAKAEPILVLAAGGDPADTVETAHIFRDLGCQRFLVTRLDIVHRLGSVMAVPEALGIAFAEALSVPAPGSGLVPFAPEHLARLLLKQV
jgi:flagellar biosynthesis protein FlhF